MSFYRQQLEAEAFGHVGLGLGRLSAAPGKNTAMLIDAIALTLGPFPFSKKDPTKMKRFILEDAECQTLAHGLRVAAEKFMANAKLREEMREHRLAEQFDKQAMACRELARKVDDRDDLQNMPFTSAALIDAAPILLNGCNAMIGLATLLLERDDLPPGVREALSSSHRLEEAKAAVRLAEGKPVADEACDHFQSDGRGCCRHCGHFHGKGPA